MSILSMNRLKAYGIDGKKEVTENKVHVVKNQNAEGISQRTTNLKTYEVLLSVFFGI